MRFLKAIHSHQFWGWLGIIVYAAAVSFPHELVQKVVNAYAERVTLHTLYHQSASIAITEATVLTLILLWRLWRHGSRVTLVFFWVVTLGLIFFTWRAFTANNTELVHYPQYIPEGFGLMALTLSPAETLAWITLFASFDEGYQYAVLSWWRKVPFDFNDVYMDLLGGAVGMLVAMAFLHCGRRMAGVSDGPAFWKRPGIRAILAVLLIGILLWASGYMLLFEDKADTRHWFSLSRFRAPAFWFQVVENGPNKYHTLSPLEGPILILLTIGLYAWIDWRVKISAGK